MNAKRYAGKLKQWNGERGFGFIVSDDSGQDLFVHISSFPRDGMLPVTGEPLTFEVAPDGPNKKRAVRIQRGGVAQPTRPRPSQSTTERLSRSPAPQSFGTRILVVLLLAALGLYGYKHYEARANSLRDARIQTMVDESPDPVQLYEPPPRSASQELYEPAPRTAPKPLISATPPVRPAFHCDGRNLCSQMTSCEEATRFLQNCPGMKMDGNNDGIPCEKQWCH